MLIRYHFCLRSTSTLLLLLAFALAENFISDVRIFPWGMRVCSSAGPGQIKTNAYGHEVFEVENACEANVLDPALVFVYEIPDLKQSKHLEFSLTQSRRTNPCMRIVLLVFKSVFVEMTEIKQVIQCNAITVVFVDSFVKDPLLLTLQTIASSLRGAETKNVYLQKSSRLFYVFAYMRSENVSRIFYLENEYLPFTDLVQLGNKYRKCSVHIGVSREWPTASCYLGFSYFDTGAVLLPLLEHYIDRIVKNETSGWVGKQLCETEMIADFVVQYHHKNLLTLLPSFASDSCAFNKQGSTANHGILAMLRYGFPNYVGLNWTHPWGACKKKLDSSACAFQGNHPCQQPVLRLEESHVTLIYGNNTYADNSIQALPACVRSKRYQFSTFGNLDSTLRSHMLLDLTSASPRFSESTQDRRGSAPLVTGDTFRSFCTYICEIFGCNFKTQDLKPGDCIFLEGNNENKVGQHLQKILEKVGNLSLVIVSHNSDYSYPLNTPKFDLAYDYTTLLESHTVFHWFASNCYWRGASKGQSRPDKLTCIPIGIPNRYTAIGVSPARFFNATTFQQNRSGVLLVSFQTSSVKPERMLALKYIQSLNSPTWVTQAWYDKIEEWHQFASKVRTHRFTLCPAGNGLDTHRHWEVLLLGGIPVVKSSSLDSMFDDLPVVILKEWSDLTETRLAQEWERIQRSHFLLDKLFWPYWENQVRFQSNLAKHQA
eukprot:g45617.t1